MPIFKNIVASTIYKAFINFLIESLIYFTVSKTYIVIMDIQKELNHF